MKNKCCVNVKVYFKIIRVRIWPYPPFPITQLCNSLVCEGMLCQHVLYMSASSDWDKGLSSTIFIGTFVFWLFWLNYDFSGCLICLRVDSLIWHALAIWPFLWHLLHLPEFEMAICRCMTCSQTSVALLLWYHRVGSFFWKCDIASTCELNVSRVLLCSLHGLCQGHCLREIQVSFS